MDVWPEWLVSRLREEVTWLRCSRNLDFLRYIALAMVLFQSVFGLDILNDPKQEVIFLFLDLSRSIYLGFYGNTHFEVDFRP